MEGLPWGWGISPKNFVLRLVLWWMVDFNKRVVGGFLVFGDAPNWVVSLQVKFGPSLIVVPRVQFSPNLMVVLRFEVSPNWVVVLQFGISPQVVDKWNMDLGVGFEWVGGV